MFGRCWVPIRRFGLWQNGKLRPIDDYPASGPNQTAATHEAIYLGWDRPHRWPHPSMGAYGAIGGADGEFDIVLPSGATLKGLVYPDWFEQGVSGLSLFGRTYYLHEAYKPLGRAPAHGALSVIAVHNPIEDRPELFLQHSVPFSEPSLL